MTTFRDAILGPLDTVRSVGGILGLRVFSVTIRVRTWDGGQPGQGGYTDSEDIPLLNKMSTGQTYPVRVRQVSRRDIMASGGIYTDRDLKVGPITPPYPAGMFPAGGFDDSTMDPALSPADAATEIFWNVQGPLQGFPAGGSWCSKVGEEYTALHALVFLRAGATRP